MAKKYNLLEILRHEIRLLNLRKQTTDDKSEIAKIDLNISDLKKLEKNVAGDVQRSNTAGRFFNDY